jgi:hypothetical protein
MHIDWPLLPPTTSSTAKVHDLVGVEFLYVFKKKKNLSFADEKRFTFQLSNVLTSPTCECVLFSGY